MARTSRPEGGGGGGVRLFLALDLPDGARTRIARWLDSVVGGRPELRPVSPAALHVTLIFLGRRAQEQLPEIWGAAASATADLPAPTLRPAELVPLPRRRPRLLTLALADDDDRAGAVHAALERALADAGLHEPEPRPFWPHVTLARVRGRSRLGSVDGAPPPATAFRAPGLTLYRSELHPSGARYVPLERLQLGRSR